MAENSLAFGKIFSLIKEDTKLMPLFNEYEAELRESQRLHAAIEHMRIYLNSVSLDHMMVCEAYAAMKEQTEEQIKANETLEICYSQALKIEHLVDNDKFDNISKYSILVKEKEAKAELDSLEKRNTAELKNFAIMESRHLVKELREVQATLDRSQQELDAVKQSIKEHQYRRGVNLQLATEQLNKKIVSVLHQRKQMLQLQQELASCRPHKPQEQPLAQDVMMIPAPEKPLYKSALDLLNNFSNGNIAKKTNESNPVDENCLRSILVDCNRTNQNPSKQVRFAPSPAYEHTNDNDGVDNWEVLFQQMDVNLENLNRLPSAWDSPNVSFTNSPSSFAESSNSANVVATEFHPTTSLGAFNRETRFDQLPSAVIIASKSIPPTSLGAFDQGNEFNQSFISVAVASDPHLTTSPEDFATEMRINQPISHGINKVGASDSLPTTSRDVLTRATVLNTATLDIQTQSTNNSPDDTMSDDQDASGNTLDFSASNNFFFNFSDDINKQTTNNDYDL